MKKQYRIILTVLFAAVLSVCGSKSVWTPLAPATATKAPVQPTQTPRATTTVLSTEIPAASISFANDVMPIFKNSCIKCHGGEQIKEG